jgi:Asp-tRNA(Asn)/Glu-tRNA(Gln) amidotransferase A subunit family amidase
MLARAVEGLRAAGLRGEAAALPPAFAAMDAAHRTLMSAAVARGFDAIEAQAGDRLSGDLRAFIHRGRGETQAALAAARAAVAAVHEALAALAAGGAVFLWPSAPGEAPQGMATGSAVLNRPWSLLGYGVITVPAFAGPAGLPLGLQLIDPAPGAPRLFTAAALAETALARPTREKTP